MPKRSTAADGSTTVRGKAATVPECMYFDKANDCYFATWRDGDGKRPQKVRGKTQAEATSRRDAAIEEWRPRLDPGGSRFTAATTVSELAEWWLLNVAPHRMRASSLGTVGKRLARTRLVTRRRAGRSCRRNRCRSGSRELLGNASSPDRRRHAVTLNQVLECAIDHRLIAVNPAKRVKPPRVPKSHRPPPRRADAQRLVAACGAAPLRRGRGACCSCRAGGCPRCSGLAWSDLDLDAKEPTATVRRAMVQATASAGCSGRRRARVPREGTTSCRASSTASVRSERPGRRASRCGTGVADHHYEGQPVDLVFTTEDGGLVARQHIDKLIRSTAEGLGIDTTGLGTHVGRRSVVTAMSEDGIPLDDIARHVGHASATTTAGYVRHLGNRPITTTQAASRVLDPNLDPATVASP